ncbi:hypothetical protein B14911_10432 [Bacillus sp. NRRL B-14911]|nr:hypothetical protein B14911_10432 [Bacillus sp. NRRL B-14911]
MKLEQIKWQLIQNNDRENIMDIIMIGLGSLIMIAAALYVIFILPLQLHIKKSRQRQKMLENEILEIEFEMARSKK